MPTARFVAGRTGVRDAEKLPFLHPQQPPSGRGIFGGYISGGGRDKRKAMARLQTKPDEPLTTLANFARATRRQNKEFSAEIHPLSGRVMAMQRGGRHGVGVGAPISRARSAAERLAARSSNPVVQERADRLAREGAAGPRRIQAHNHPKSDTVHRTMPSAQDTRLASNMRDRTQNVVVSQRRDPQGRGGKNTSAVWHGPAGEPNPKDLQRQMRRDISTLPTSILNEERATGKQRAAVGVSRAARRVASRATGGRVSTDYDTSFAAAHGGRKVLEGKTGYYSRQTYLKRDEKGHPVAGRALQLLGVSGVATAAGANRITRSGGAALRRVADVGEAELKALKDDARRRTAQAGRSGGKQVYARPEGMTKPAARRQRKAGERAQLKETQRQVNAVREMAGRVDSRRTVERLTAGGLSVGLPSVYLGDRIATAKRDRRDVDRQYAGAAAGVGAHQAAVYGTKGVDRKIAERIKADPKAQAEWEAHRAKHGNPGVGDPRNKAMMRDYPRSLPGARWKRGMSRFGAGKTGLAVAGGSGAVGAAAATPRRKETKAARDVEVGYRTVQTDPMRVGEAALGAALLGWSVPRHRFVGALVDHGVYEAERRGGGVAARRAYITGTGFASTARELSGQGAKVARKIPKVSSVVDKIPVKARPTVATAIGGILLSNARPVRREHFTPAGR